MALDQDTGFSYFMVKEHNYLTFLLSFYEKEQHIPNYTSRSHERGFYRVLFFVENKALRPARSKLRTVLVTQSMGKQPLENHIHDRAKYIIRFGYELRKEQGISLSTG